MLEKCGFVFEGTLKILFTKTAIFMTVEYMLWLKIIILTSKCTVPTEIKTVVVAAGIHMPKQNISSKAAVLNNNQSRIRYHKAYYSLDRGDGIEHSALFVPSLPMKFTNASSQPSSSTLPLPHCRTSRQNAFTLIISLA